uniref:RagB/SusD family nutrient uptake outer membrane protein n=2 Tax=Flavobacterium sp. TaxID=239 RepID=UPI00404B5A44
MKYIKYLSFALIGVFTISCEDFLNPLPDTIIVSQTYFKSDADLQTGIIGIYDAIQGVNENTVTNDNNVNRGVIFEYLLTEHRSDNTRSQTTEGTRADFHRYIVNADNIQSEDYYASMYQVIYRANNIINYIDVANPENVQKYLGEAKFLRAYAYFNLVRLFGAVPLVTEVVLATDRESLFTRVDIATIYQQIALDLQDAVDGLDNTYKSRASKAAAQALLAKVYMSQPNPNYVAAELLCEDVINSNAFSLQSNFYDVFYNELNSEIIFAIQYAFGIETESQSFSAEFTSTLRQGRQDGLNMVNQNLIDEFNAIGGTRTAVSFKTFTSSGRSEVTKFLPEGSNVNTVPPTYGPNPQNSGNDWIVLRYADVLLLHVEATIASGTATSDPAALASFQQVKDRAFPATAPNVITNITKNDLLRERRVELAFENHRFFDLLRFGVADEVLSAHAASMVYPDYNPRALLLPIPAREINLSGGLLTQNPGY